MVLVVLFTVSTYAQDTLWNELNDQVVVLYQQGRYSEATKVAKEALKVAKNTFGSDHPNVAQSLNDLALLYKTQGQYTEAEPLYKQALAIREKVLGPDHPDVADSLENYADLLRKLNREEEASVLENFPYRCADGSLPYRA